MATFKAKKPTFGWTHRDDEHARAGVVHKHFASPYKLAEYLDANIETKRAKNDPDYYEPIGINKGIEKLRDGAIDLVPKAKAMMDKLQVSLPSTQRTWHTTPVGAFPNVGAYLAGEPENMFSLNTEKSDNAPIRIWVNVLPSGGVSGDALMTRGAVLVALVNLLKERRSQVSITAYADQPARNDAGVVVCWDLPTSPINLAQLCTSLGYPEVVQRLAFYACNVVNPKCTGGWLRGHCPGYSYDEAKVRQDLNAAPDDVIIPAAYLNDTLHNKPLDFLHRELTRILGESESNSY